MPLRPRIFLLFALCLLLALGACARRPSGTAQVPRSLSPMYAVSVAPFTQPMGTSQLISGRIPDNQGRIAPEMLPALDVRLRHVLGQGKRPYRFVARQALPESTASFHSSEQPQTLPHWIAYGKKHGAQFLLVPQILNWHERQGSRAGVTQAAHVRLEFFLLRVDSGVVQERAVFEEQQTGLADDLLGVGSFFRRGGQWITAEELAEEGMRKAVRELGL